MATGTPLIVPVLIKLLEYKGEPLTEWVRLKLIETGEVSINQNQIADYLRSMAFTCCILLDGLNEVPPIYREKVLGEITRFALEYPRHRLIITSRVQDESWRQLRQGSVIAETLVIQPITPNDAQKYLAAHLGVDDSTNLWVGLDPRMRELALTPLMLWMIKEAYLKAKTIAPGLAIRIPDTRGALYHSFIDQLLLRDDERGLGRKVPERVRLKALGELAFYLNKQKTLTLPAAVAAKILGSDEILAALLINGLLLGKDNIRFAPHQTIQEHFAARALHDRVLPTIRATGLKRLVQRTGVVWSDLEYARDPWWWETFIQLAGLIEDSNALALALADINPWLAWWCCEEGGSIDKHVREKIGQRSERLVYSDNVNDRRSAANTLIRLPTSRVKDYLVQLSIDVDASISRTSLKALINLREDGIEIFLKNLDQLLLKQDPRTRAEWGRAIHDIDPRPGIGLRPDGLPDIVWSNPIPPGTYPIGHVDEGDNPPPEHALTYSYQIAKYPITYRQFQAFIAAPDGWKNEKWWEGLAASAHYRAQPDEQEFKYWNHPREHVSWYEALAFCRWLSVRLGGAHELNRIEQWAVRLPTEIEWEIAARGKDGRLYPYAGDYDPAKGNTEETDIRQTSAVGIFPDGMAPCGALDMSGNVWQWCLTASRNPNIAAVEENLRSDAWWVLRGGSWYDLQFCAHAVYRSLDSPDRRDPNHGVGFRVVRASSR